MLKSFDLTTTLSLMQNPARYGLGVLIDPTVGRNLLPRMVTGTTPVVVDQAVSASRMTFDGLGFAAGSLSAMTLRSMAMPPRARPHTDVVFRLDRPFAVLVRTVRGQIPLFAGWVDPS